MWKSCPSDPVPLVDVRTRVSLSADTNMSAIESPSETIAYCRDSPSNSPRRRFYRTYRTMQFSLSGTSSWSRLGILPEWPGARSSS